jgi:hypothetical protein
MIKGACNGADSGAGSALNWQKFRPISKSLLATLSLSVFCSTPKQKRTGNKQFWRHFRATKVLELPRVKIRTLLTSYHRVKKPLQGFACIFCLARFALNAQVIVRSNLRQHICMQA